MSIETTVTVRRICHWCGGMGKGLKTCEECKGEGVSEQQVGIREFRHMLEADAKAERADHGDWHADPVEETEARDAEQS